MRTNKETIHTFRKVDIETIKTLASSEGECDVFGDPTKLQLMAQEILAYRECEKRMGSLPDDGTTSYVTTCCGFRFIGMNHSPEMSGVCRNCGGAFSCGPHLGE